MACFSNQISLKFQYWFFKAKLAPGARTLDLQLAGWEYRQRSIVD
ncbi:MAG TPA: hypothetical protein VH596_06455 [Terriglobales bacterium]|jgi:hypothetical protein